MLFEFDLIFFIFMFEISNKWWNDIIIKCDGGSWLSIIYIWVGFLIK